MIIPKQIIIARYYPYLLLLFILFTGCAPKRDLVYFSDMTSSSIITDTLKQDIIIDENDILSVTVNSLNPESNRLFSGNINASADPSTQKVGYKVNKDGIIQLPLIGNYKVKGLTIERARIGILTELSKQIIKPVVDVKLLNFKITVIGEVNKPSNFNIPDDKINLLEALGLAGDMTVYGKRENVLVIRNENGSKTMKRLNLNKQETITSPYFYLKQNDIVYVEPDRAKAFEYSQNTRILPIIIASISAAAVLAAVLLKR
ncbi:MAG: polysaccharide export outer membrane protein [Mucilaginibacter sp.]|nr:polysaccharide export outer membrane protein [Mucilaginibacter sp.]